MFLYPFGDFHSLNLGWFLLQFKDWTEKIQEYLDNGGGTTENLANVIAPVFNAANTYAAGDYVLYNNELYKANQAVNPGTWDPNAWTRCLVTEEMGSGSGGVDNVARLMIAGQYSNTYNYQKYAICRYNDKLWMCNTNLPAGGEEWEPSHWDEITVGAGLTGLRRSVETLSNAISDLQNIVGNGSLTGFTATDLTSAANELMGSLNANESAIAIVADGNTHEAISIGQYVFIKNNSTLASGLYRATEAIPLNGTISSTNVIAVTSGGLNAIGVNTTLVRGTANPDLCSSSNIYGYKLGKLFFLSGWFMLSSVPAQGDTVITGLPKFAFEQIVLVYDQNANTYRSLIAGNGATSLIRGTGADYTGLTGHYLNLMGVYLIYE